MNNQKKVFSPLAKHILIILVIKTMVLYCLWYTLIRPNKVKVDVNQIYNMQGVESMSIYQKEIDHDRR